MNLRLSLDKDFEKAISRLKQKYGEQFQKLNSMHETNLNFTSFIDGFVDHSAPLADVAADTNSNSTHKTASALIKEMNKPFTKLLSFNKIFYELKKKYGLDSAIAWLESEYNGTLYMHDAYTSSILPYCYNYDLSELSNKGLFFLGKDGETGIPQHWETFNNHFFEFLAYASNSQAGAVGVASYLIEAFFFYKKDLADPEMNISNPEKFKKQQFQSFVYNVNQAFIRTNEPAFTNLTIFDREYLIGLFGDKTYRDGTYVIDYIEEIIQFQKDFMVCVAEIRKKYMFTFPVLTFSLLWDDEAQQFVDQEFYNWAVEHNTKWFDSNFYVGADITALSSCCRLVSNMEDVHSKLNGYMNSTGGSSLSIGSIKVSTINLMRIGLLAGKDKFKFFDELDKAVRINIKALDVQRHIIKRNIEKGLLPMYTYGLMKMENQYSTIGLNGAYNLLELMGYIKTDEFGYESLSQEGTEFMGKVLDRVNFLKDDNEFDYSINIEFIPAERASVINCKKDKLLYPNEKIDVSLYANQYIDLRSNSTLEERMRLAGLFDKRCGGGNILHIDIEGSLSTSKCKEIIETSAKMGVVYFALTGKISCCEDKHEYTLDNICPVCEVPVTNTWQRIVGYYTPIANWGKERRAEARERKWYELE